MQLSYCEDKKLNRDAHSYYMSEELRSYIDKSSIKDHPHATEDADADADGRGFPSSSSSLGQRKISIHDADSRENPLAKHHSQTELVPRGASKVVFLQQADI